MGVVLIVAAASWSFAQTPPVNKVEQASIHVKTLVLGSGCFWGAEKRYEHMEGVLDAVSGYADGHGFSPTYKEITKHHRRFDENNYAEVVKVTYNANVISTEQLLKSYFESHDPTQKNRQGNDVGTQYRSTILFTDDEQKMAALKLRDLYQVKLTQAGFAEIQTKIKKLDTFHPAEAYHQDYLAKNPNGYCPDHATGVVFDMQQQEEIANKALLAGKHIVILDAKGYCPYCEKLKKTVINDYEGTIALHFRHADQLQSLEIETPTWATPTIIFIENGKEVYAHQGFMDKPTFYKALGAFKLGDSEAFRVAFNSSTDAPFCKQYDLFKKTGEGVFIDKLSGAPLFDTKDRFNSGTGWLSFKHPVKGSVTYHHDNSHGMRRTEIRSKSSGIHLGHVFKNEGPRGSDRYCINATVLEFVAR
jgi:peptide methionine sulfoxide reductase msrA/msrB